MKYVFMTVLALSFTMMLKAADRDLFKYDKNHLEKSMTDMSRIEQEFNNNPGITAAELVQRGHMDQGTFDQLNQPFGFTSEPPLGIPSFLWGCVFGVVGMVIVLIMTDKDKGELQKALYGCIVSYALVSVFYFIVLVSFNNTP
jgi:hypothetical protein